jgi:hypothetical protein
MPQHAYPADLARYVRDAWDHETPPPAVLDELLSVAYQATLLHDEDRPVTFRLVLAEPAEFPEAGGPPRGVHRLCFEHPRPLTPHELRRLSPAAKYHRSLIGVRASGGGELEIWGVLQSGPRWLASARGGRGSVPQLPPSALVIRAMGAGRIAVARGEETLAELRGGEVSGAAMDVFQSKWLGQRFIEARTEIAREHAAARAAADRPWPDLDPSLVRRVSQQMIKRVISTIRDARHGGALIFVPTACSADVLAGHRHLRLKYTFSEDEPRRRYRTLILSVMRALSEGAEPGASVTALAAYEVDSSPRLAVLDEAIFEMSHLIAGLADVDGAVVLTQRFEVLGFGAEIAGDLPEVPVVARALDLEGTLRAREPADGVGTRHRSAYRLAGAVPDAIAIVVSQDGAVRFVANVSGEVTYWEHGPAGIDR